MSIVSTMLDEVLHILRTEKDSRVPEQRVYSGLGGVRIRTIINKQVQHL